MSVLRSHLQTVRHVLHRVCGLLRLRRTGSPCSPWIPRQCPPDHEAGPLGDPDVLPGIATARAIPPCASEAPAAHQTSSRRSRSKCSAAPALNKIDSSWISGGNAGEERRRSAAFGHSASVPGSLTTPSDQWPSLAAYSGSPSVGFSKALEPMSSGCSLCERHWIGVASADDHGYFLTGRADIGTRKQGCESGCASGLRGNLELFP